jgi:rhodanese-related sulfurtransferase
MSTQHIHPADLMANKTADMCILDVRTATEVKAACLPGCLHIPLHELTATRLQQEIARQGKDSHRIYLLCQGGKRAEKAADQLRDQVNAEFVVIDGGINAMREANIPLQHTGKASMSLERQVRIVAGLLVLIGVLLGTVMNPLFYALSGVVGAGLMFAGITDTCMMGMLIARMPWNR